jgi:hypothetical protein
VGEGGGCSCVWIISLRDAKHSSRLIPTISIDVKDATSDAVEEGVWERRLAWKDWVLQHQSGSDFPNRHCCWWHGAAVVRALPATELAAAADADAAAATAATVIITAAADAAAVAAGSACANDSPHPKSSNAFAA